MPYKRTTFWIFVILLLLVALMILIPNSITIWLGFILLPALVLYQAYIILKAKDKSDHSFQDKWYDN